MTQLTDRPGIRNAVGIANESLAGALVVEYYNKKYVSLKKHDSAATVLKLSVL